MFLTISGFLSQLLKLKESNSTPLQSDSGAVISIEGRGLSSQLQTHERQRDKEEILFLKSRVQALESDLSQIVLASDGKLFFQFSIAEKAID